MRIAHNNDLSKFVGLTVKVKSAPNEIPFIREEMIGVLFTVEKSNNYKGFYLERLSGTFRFQKRVKPVMPIEVDVLGRV